MWLSGYVVLVTFIIFFHVLYCNKFIINLLNSNKTKFSLW